MEHSLRQGVVTGRALQRKGGRPGMGPPTGLPNSRLAVHSIGLI